MVYIDGGHAYSSVLLDIQEYAPLVKDGGYLSGDDLVFQVGEVDDSFARVHCEEHEILDPKTGRFFHPGVTVAVDEFFGGVSVYAGFWVMQKQGNTWRKVTL